MSVRAARRGRWRPFPSPTFPSPRPTSGPAAPLFIRVRIISDAGGGVYCGRPYRAPSNTTSICGAAKAAMPAASNPMNQPARQPRK